MSNWCLQAFAEVARLGSFSAAARHLHLTQPALSLRIKQLEEATGHQLLRRSRKGVALTPAGQRLMEYVNLREIVDGELSSEMMGGSPQKLRGNIRIAGHFSIINHFAVPALAKFLRENLDVQIEAIIREDDEVPQLLEEGECELALLQRPIQRDSYQSHLLGDERYVLIRSSRFKTRSGVFIDSHPSDVITDDFFKLQSLKKRRSDYARSYLHNETGIVRAVELGLGQAVVAEHEIQKGAKVEIVPGYRPLLITAYLQYAKHARRSNLLSATIAELVSGALRIFK
jgi:LysR family transcriptional regulator for metE and metH